LEARASVRVTVECPRPAITSTAEVDPVKPDPDIAIAVGIAQALATLFVGLIGAYLVHSYRRKIALSVAEKRLAAYSALWSRMVIASPVRLGDWVDGHCQLNGPHPDVTTIYCGSNFFLYPILW